ncbi:MAG TPA: hypothetical protein VFN09_03805 [Rhodanobacteraceae bacterium]|nr:hypothetical protein [Rhodanobacteraceae bacterium]
MQSFEEVRSHVSGHHTLGSNEPYLISIELPLDGTRRQGVYLSELEDDDGRRFLRVSSPVAPLGDIAPQRCLRFNWTQRVGYLALNDLDSVPYLQLCENRPYAGLDSAELDRLIQTIGQLADRLERLAAQTDAH